MHTKYFKPLDLILANFVRFILKINYFNLLFAGSLM